MFKKKKTYVILVLVVIIIGGIFYFRGRKPKIQYETSIAEKGNLMRTVSVTGNLEPETQAKVSFKLSGRLEKINFDVGDKIEKGDLIASIDKGTLYEKLKQAQAEVKAQKETLSFMRRQKNADVYNSNQRSAQEAIVKKSQAAVSAVQEQLKETLLYAPISGLVIKRSIDPGESVTVNKPILTIAGKGELVIEANVAESDIANVAIGQKAMVTFDAFSSDKKFKAQVSKIDPASTVIQDVVYYRVKLKLTQPNDQLKIGMSADIDINTAQKKDIIMIPQRAIQTEGNQKYVKILKVDNTTEKKNIQIGMAGDDGMVEVTSGLSGGEKIVTLTKKP